MDVKVVGVVVAVLLALTLTSNMVWSAGRMTAAPVEVTATGHRLYRAATRAALMAEQQRNCLIAHAEISKAAAFAEALRILMTDGEITAAFKVDIRRLVGDIEAAEQRIHRKIAAKAPEIMPTGGFTARTGMVP